MANILSAQKICKSFNGVQVLKDVEFDLRENEIHGLVGENGAGKSTLMKIIAGDYKLDSGELRIDGKPVKLRNPTDSLNYGIRIIYQEFNLVRTLSVAENIFIGEYPRTSVGLLDRKKMDAEAKKVLEQLGQEIDVTKCVRDISVAQQQIVEIAKAVRKNCRIQIMDEPTAALNDQETVKLFEMIRRMRDNGTSIIIISHRLSEQFELTDRITVMRGGETVGTVNTNEVSNDELIRMMVGRKLDEMYAHDDRKPGEVLLEAKNLCVNDQVRDINLTVHKGEVVSVYGLMGAGQTQLADALFGSTRAKSGQIFFKGKPLRMKSPVDSVKNGMGYITEDRKADGLLGNLSVLENVSIVSIGRYANPAGILSRKKEQASFDHWVQRLNVKFGTKSQKIVSLSGGNQQKALIARWLSNDVDLLIMNLPTRGIDVGAKAEIYSLIDLLCKEGKGVLVFSLEMPEILGISDRIYVMCNGEITGEVTAAEANQELLLKYAVSKYLHESPRREL